MATVKQSIAQYPNGFTDGVTVRGVPLLNTYSGQVWWVDASGAQIGDGKFNRPFANIDTAITTAWQATRFSSRPGIPRPLLLPPALTPT